MKLPIIISEGLDLGLYSTLEMAQISIEPTDVLNGIYSLYDSSGNILVAKVVETPNGSQVEIHPTGATDQEALAELLRDFLKETGSEETAVNTKGLDQLVELSENFFE